MYLKRLELTGFKSFKEKTKIEFSQGITAIIGPNGSGKSNVSDAIRWVLGEQSAKSLRGMKMEDIIFSGTQNKKPLGAAIVSIIIDNSEKKLSLPYEEIAVTRKLYRSGDSEYQINGNNCRLRDILELFMDTGIGRTGYSIISQGNIDEILSTATSERRVIFEEAAGIIKYKTRCEEASSKLEKEKENLVRVEDIIAELQSRLPSLEIQAQKAKKFLTLSEDLKILRINAFLINEEKIAKDIEVSKENISLLEENLKDADKNNLEMQIEKKKHELETLEELIQATRGYISDTKILTQQKENDVLLLTEQLKNIDLGTRRTTDDNDRKREEIQAKENFLSGLIKEEKEILNDIDTKKQILQKEIDVLNNFDTDINALEKIARELVQGLTNPKDGIEINNAKSRLNLLIELNQNYEGYHNSVKTVLRYKKHNPNALGGVLSTVGDIITVSGELQTAIEIAFGATLQNIITQTEEDAKEAINYLLAQKAGRATFLPLNKIKGRQNFQKLPNGAIGWAKDLINYEDKFENIISSLISDVLVVENIDIGIQLSKTINCKIVTLRGEALGKSGAITGGSISQTAKILGRTKEIDTLKAKIEKLVLEEDSLKQQLQKQLEENNIKIKDIRFQKDKEQQKITEIKLEIAEIESKLKFNKGKEQESLNQMALLKEQIETSKFEIDNFEQSKEYKILEIAQKKQEIANLTASLKQKEEDFEKMESIKKENIKNLDQMQKEQKENDRQLLELKAEHNKLLMRVENLEEKRSGLFNEIWEEYEMTYQTALGYKQDGIDIKQIAGIKNEIRELGTINVEAPEEYLQIKERFTFLQTQKEDIENSTKKLKDIIKDLLELMEKQFYQQFGKISDNFSDVFKEMFGGGSAYLKLLDPENPLSSAIEIIAQPPGKKLQSLTLMSGGERTLTAIALLFSILRMKPSPFCILDEMEAALDEANNIKFANYVSNFPREVQFILITHKKSTIKAANCVYGVTMEEEGISKLLSIAI